MVSVSFPSSSIFGIRKRGNMVSAMFTFRFDTAREGFIGYAEREREHRLNRGCFFFFRLAEAFAQEFEFQGYLSLIGKIHWLGVESFWELTSLNAWNTECAFIFGSQLSDTRGLRCGEAV